MSAPPSLGVLYYWSRSQEHFYDHALIQKWIGLYGCTPIVIDHMNQHKQVDRPPYMFKTIAEARKHPDLIECKWVWLDHRAAQRWDEVPLPRENAVYCIGQDQDGFLGDSPENHGDCAIKVAHPNKQYEDSEWPASQVAALLMFEVFHK